MNRVSFEKIENNAEQVVSLDFKQISVKTREDNLEKIRRIMIEGALNQLKIENYSDVQDAQEEKVVKVENNEKIEFFDF